MSMQQVLSSTDTSEACLNLVNKLIVARELPILEVTNLKDIDSHLIAYLFENICGNSVPDLLPFSDSVNEAHNVQAVIDTLSLDVLGISLSHITGEDIIAGDANAIFNLLEVFEGLVLFISPGLSRPESLSNNGVKSPNINTTSVKTRDTLSNEENSMNGISTNKGIHPSVKILRKKSSVQLPHSSTAIENAIIPSTEVDNQNLKREFATAGVRVKSASNRTSGRADNYPPLEQRILDDHLIFKGDENKMEPKFKKLTSTTRKVRKLDAGTTKRKENVSNYDIKTNPAAQSSKENIDNGIKKGEGVAEVNKLVKPPARIIVRKRKALKPIAASTLEIFINMEESTAAEHPLVPAASSRQFEDSKHPHFKQDSADYNDRATEVKVVVEPPPKTKIFDKKRKAFKPLPISRVKSDENQVIENKYEENLENRMKKFLVQHDYNKHRASQIKKAYTNAIKSPLHRPITPLCDKSFLLPTNLRRRRSTSYTLPKRLHAHAHSSKLTHSVNRRDRAGLKQDQPAFLKKLQEDFPFASVSPHTERCMSKKNERHLLSMHKRVKSSLLQKPRAQIQLEEATRRQNVLSNIMKKEIQNSQHLKKLQEDKISDRKVGYSMRDARLRSVRLKKYFNDYHEDMRKKLQSRNIAEEQLLKKVHEEALNIEKEQVQVLCKRAKEMNDQDAAHNKNYLEALENFYETQFAMLSESLAAEKHGLKERTKAQKRVLQLMERDMRKKLESEVTNLQQQVIDSQRDIHFRELDAEMYLEDQRDRCSAAIP